MAYVFVYGTLRYGCCNSRLLSDSDYLGERLTKDYYHMSVSGIVPFIDVAPSDSNYKGKVKGDLFLVHDEDTMDSLDALEGHPDWYQRHQMELDTGEIAWIYLNPSAHIDPITPDDEGHLVCLPKG